MFGLQSIEAPAVKHVSMQRTHTIIVLFGDDDCCDLEWFEFFI
jgi:hypothetical protein